MRRNDPPEGPERALAMPPRMREKIGMRFRKTLLFAAFYAFLQPLSAAVSLPSESTPAVAGEVKGPAKEAMDEFQAGRHAKALDLARPLAEKGNADALYLMGFAHETGNGVEASREKAIEYYHKAADAKHKDAVYRLSFILLASEDEKERDQAREELEKAAKDDPAVAGRILGEAYLRGMLSPAADPDKAVFWWKRAADAGDIPSLLLIARFYEGQFGFPELKDLKQAMEYYGKAAGLGAPAAMASYGSRLLSGDESIRDEAKGREWIKKAIEAKEISGYLVLGDFEENVKKDLKAALAAYERGKDAGQIDSMLRAADFYIEGKAGEKDVERGVTVLKQAAEAGSAVASLKLAVMELSAEKPDLVSGYGHLLAAANGNLVEAQNELGLFYLSGKLAVADPAAGVAWLTRAAKGGYAPAQANLGTLYERGVAGVERSFENAGQLFTLAANQGHGAATLALANLVLEGHGTEADPVKAWALATLAAERGQEEATELATKIATKLDEKQREAAAKELETMRGGLATEPVETPDAE